MSAFFMPREGGFNIRCFKAFLEANYKSNEEPDEDSNKPYKRKHRQTLNIYIYIILNKPAKQKAIRRILTDTTFPSTNKQRYTVLHSSQAYPKVWNSLCVSLLIFYRLRQYNRPKLFS